MIGILVEDLQNKLIAFIVKVSTTLFKPMFQHRLTLGNIEDKDINNLMSIKLFKYNISKHLKEVKNIKEIDRFRITHALENLYSNVYTILKDTNYETVTYNIVYTICEDMNNLLSTIKKYKSYNGITTESLDKSLKSLRDRYNNVVNNKQHQSMFSIGFYIKLSPEIKALAESIRVSSELLDNTVSKSLSEQTISLIKLYKKYEDNDSRFEIERQLTLISDFLKEQIEVNALPGSKKYLDNKLGISSHYIQSVIDNNNWVE